MAYTAAVLDSQIDVSDIRDLLVQGDTAFPTINFTLPAGFTGLTWRVRGTFMQFNLATQSEELAVTGSTTVSIAWPVGSNFTTYYGEMQIVLVGTDALGNIVTKATGYVNVQRDYSISTVEAVDENLFEQLMAEMASSAVMVDQTTEQTLTGGVPKLSATRVISDNNHLADKKFVEDAVAEVALDHNDLDGLQGGTTDEFYHVTAAEKTIIENTSGTNTGDQDVSGAISTHNTDAGAHAGLARKTETMQLLISRTIGAGENVSAITWTQDDAGNALALTGLEILINIPANSLSGTTQGYVTMRVNGESGSGKYVYSTISMNFMTVGYFKKNYGMISARLYSAGKRLFGDSISMQYDGSTYGKILESFGTLFDVITVTNIYLTMSVQLPEGTTIRIYGRTA